MLLSERPKGHFRIINFGRKKMKQTIALIICVVMIFSMAACGSTATQPAATAASETAAAPAAASEATGEGKKVAYLTMSSEGDYWQFLEACIVNACSEYGISVDIINADYDPVRQVEQIENAILQGYDLFFVLATDPNAIADSCKKAMDAGIPVYEFIKDSGEGFRTSFRGTDETVIGTSLVEYAGEWASETFGGGNGSCNVIVVGGNSAGSETERYEAVCAAVEADPQFNILEELRAETSQSAAQSTTENLLAKYNDVDMIIFCSVEMGLGAVTYIESDASPIKDFSKFALFCGGLSQEAADDMYRAADGKGVIRGTINTGGSNDESAHEIAAQINRILSGEDFETFDIVPAVRVSVDNLSVFGY